MLTPTQLKLKLPALSILKVILPTPLSQTQVPTSSSLECSFGFCLGLQLIENNNINNAIKDTILALDLTWLDLTWLD